MTTQLVCPYLATPWALEDMLESFGQSNIPVLIVDNSPDSHAATVRGVESPNVEVVAYPENIGVAAGWNLGIKKKADQTILISQWVRLAPLEFPRRLPIDVAAGDSRQWGLDYLVRGIEKRATPYGLTFGDQGYHIISIGRQTVDTIGLFDENLYFYGNDDDYVRRLNFAGIKGQMPDWGNYQESGLFSVAFAANKRGAHPVDTARSQKANEYTKRKWGPSFADYTSPFNDAANSLKYWPKPEIGSGMGWDFYE